MNDFKWVRASKEIDWDNHLTNYNIPSHPLQSLIWGSSRQRIEGIEFNLFIAYDLYGNVASLARIEIRYFLFFFKIAWIPKGPFIVNISDRKEIINSLIQFLKAMGYVLLVTDLYIENQEDVNSKNQTIIIDLDNNEEDIFKRMHKKFQYAIRRSKRENINFICSRDNDHISYFHKMCAECSSKKDFILPGSLPLMRKLILSCSKLSKISFQLELAIYEKKIISGAIIAYSNHRAHFMWGATDKKFSRIGASESLQWYVIQKAKSLGIKSYDLEGIDKKKNFGVFKFKFRTGGNIKNLRGQEYYPLNVFIKLIFYPLRFFRNII